MFKNIKRIWSAIQLIAKTFRNYKGRFFVMLCLGFLGGLFGSVGISTAIPLFSIVTHQSNPSDFITKGTQTLFNILHIPFSVPFLLAFLIIIFTAKALMLFIAKYYNDVTTTTYEEETRKSLFAATMHSRWLSLANHKVGYVDRTILYDVQQTADALNQISSSIFTITSLTAYTLVALKISPSITLATLAFGGALFFIFKPLYYTTRKLAEKIGLTFKFASHRINESLIGAKTIKISGVEENMIELGNEHFTQLKLAKIRTAFLGYLIGLSTEPVAISFIAVLFFFSYRQISFNVIVFGVTMYIVQKIFAFVQSLQGQVQNINQSISYIKVVNAYSEEVRASQEISHGKEKFKFNKNLEFRNISFHYDKQRQDKVLDNISFKVERGSMTAILGPSGSGKTTIVDLLLRLFEPTSGNVYIDELDIAEISLPSWRQHIGYVPQDTFLINDTIENNIRFYNNKINSQDIAEAIKLANLDDLMIELTDGLQTMVGERGIKLSGGQRQRIALARALARKPEILILDEATSNLDTDSESKIQSAINNLRGKITILFITHRISSITSADQIIVIKNSKVEEIGTPEILMNNPNSYFSKISNQNF